MKALRFGSTGTLAALHLAELEPPKAADGEVLVRVHAAGLNPSDVKNVLGIFPYTTLPRTPGRDFSGTVIDGPPSLLGREVWGTGRDLGFDRDGSHAEFLTLPAGGAALKPANLSFAQAAACGVPYSTAWDALERSNTGAGTRLLVIGAGGAVGRATLALARWRGADILAAVRKPEQAAALVAGGVQTIVLGEPEALASAVRQHFYEGAEVIFDTTGFWLPAAVAALANFGRIGVIAAPADAGHVRVPILALYRRGGSLIGVNTLLYDSIACARMLNRWRAAFERDLLALPAEPREVLLEDGVAAYQAINKGYIEKIVLTTH